MIKVYGATTCKYTRMLLNNLDIHKIEYDFIDINASLANLKEFVLIRDKASCFNMQRQVGGIGIPLIVDGSLITNKWTKYLENIGINKIISDSEECLDKNC